MESLSSALLVAESACSQHFLLSKWMWSQYGAGRREKRSTGGAGRVSRLAISGAAACRGAGGCSAVVTAGPSAGYALGHGVPVFVDDTSSDPLSLVGNESFDTHYHVQRVIGSGSFGVVYAALHKRLRQPRALKVLKLDRVREPDVVIERFWREARASAALKHAGAIEVLDARVEQPGGRLYYAMELLSGVSLLTRWMSSPGRRMAPAEALGIARQVAACLTVAHAAGIVHRDIKPENIFICRDHAVRVLDFGCAFLQQEPRITTPGRLIGLPHYMPPDQLDLVRRGPDPRVDVYALGVTLYHVLSGRWIYPPHHDPLVVAKDVHLGPPADIAQVAPELPAQIHAIVRKAMARNSEDRYQRMEDLEGAIVDVIRSGGVSLRVAADASTLARTVERPRTLIERLRSRQQRNEVEEAPTAKERPTPPAVVDAARMRAADPIVSRAPNAPPIVALPVRAATSAPRSERNIPPRGSSSRTMVVIAAGIVLAAGAVLAALIIRQRSSSPITAQAKTLAAESAPQADVRNSPPNAVPPARVEQRTAATAVSSVAPSANDSARDAKRARRHRSQENTPAQDPPPGIGMPELDKDLNALATPSE